MLNVDRKYILESMKYSSLFFSTILITNKGNIQLLICFIILSYVQILDREEDYHLSGPFEFQQY